MSCVSLHFGLGIYMYIQRRYICLKQHTADAIEAQRILWIFICSNKRNETLIPHKPFYIVIGINLQLSTSNAFSLLDLQKSIELSIWDESKSCNLWCIKFSKWFEISWPTFMKSKKNESRIVVWSMSNRINAIYFTTVLISK